MRGSTSEMPRRPQDRARARVQAGQRVLEIGALLNPGARSRRAFRGQHEDTTGALRDESGAGYHPKHFSRGAIRPSETRQGGYEKDPILYQMPAPPQIVVSPGEQIRKTLRIPEDCASARYFSSPCGVHIREGEYQYDFYYGPGASVRFQVVRPNLELAAEPKLNKKLEYVHWERRQGKNVPSGKVTLHDGFAGVYVAEYGGSRHLLARRHPGGRLDRKVLEANPSSIVLCPCVRLPYSGKRATRLDASVNPEDHLLVEVTDETGTTSRIRLNEKREVIPE